MPLKDGPEVEIKSRDYWFKVVDMLQQNWALIESDEAGRTTVFFIHDLSGVFDRMLFESVEAATRGLQRNGVRRFTGDSSAKEFLAPPSPPFRESTHPNGPIYSSGRFWS